MLNLGVLLWEVGRVVCVTFNILQRMSAFSNFIGPPVFFLNHCSFMVEKKTVNKL